ncbi:MAG: hypothetical protein J6J37_10270 [Bacteroidaceae bacterium]|nr:hypothetical protein [Bacteroidaceae bacterium]
MEIKNVLFQIGGVTLIAGALAKFFLPVYGAYIYAAGAILFAIMQFICRPRGGSATLRRLVFQQQIGGICIVAAAALMFTHVRNEWIVAMFLGAIFELYTAFRIPQELEKQR